jgi:hypothetical protein
MSPIGTSHLSTSFSTFATQICENDGEVQLQIKGREMKEIQVKENK